MPKIKIPKTEEELAKTHQIKLDRAAKARAIRLERIAQRKQEILNQQLDARLEERKRLEAEASAQTSSEEEKKKNENLNENDLQREKTKDKNLSAAEKKIQRSETKIYNSDASDSESDESSEDDQVIIYKPKKQKGRGKTNTKKTSPKTIPRENDLEKQLAEMNTRFANLEALYSKNRRKDDILDSCQRQILKF